MNAKLLRIKMIKADITQRELAEQIGTTQQYISRLLCNSDGCTIGTVKRISKALHLTPQEEHDIFLSEELT